MRDVKRIDKLLKQIKDIWIENPNMRLGQLIINSLTLNFPEDSKVTDLSGLYNLEDDELSKELGDFYLGYDKK